MPRLGLGKLVAWPVHFSSSTAYAFRIIAAIAALGAWLLVAAVARVQPGALVIVSALGMTVLAAVAPFTGLLVIAGIAPLSGTVALLSGLHVSGTVLGEILVLAYLAGWFLRLAWDGITAVQSRLLLPLSCLAALIVGSVLVSLAASVPYEAQLFGGVTSQLATALGDFPHRATEPHAPYAAIRWLIVLGLCASAAAVVAHEESEPSRRRRLLRMLTAGLCGAAALNLAWYLQAVLSAPEPLRAARAYLSWMRVNVQFSDLNAAGSVLAMSALLVIGFARTARRSMIPWTALLVVLAALWLAGSRTAVAAFVLAVAIGAILERDIRWSRARIVAGAALMITAALIAVLSIWQSPRTAANIDASEAFAIRLELLHRSARMVRDNPVFGVGVGRYYSESSRFSSPSATFRHENAHSDAAQIVSELGMIGLAMFLWLLYEASRGLLSLRLKEARAFQVWWLMALIAYLLTGLAGHPLIVFESAFPFWIAAGAAAARPVQSATAFRPAAVLILVLIGLMTPLRMARARAFTLSEGPSQAWIHEEGMTYRSVGRTDLLVFQPPLTAVTLPLRIRGIEGSPAEAAVDIYLDDTLVNRVVARTDQWTHHRLVLSTVEGYHYRRIRLEVRGGDESTNLLVGRAVLH